MKTGKLLLQFAIPSTLATILGQFVSFLICAAYLWRSRVFRVKPSDFRPSWTYLKPVLPLAFIRLFGAGDDVLYVTFAVYCLRIYLSLLIFTCLQKTGAMFLQSIGHTRSAVPLSILRDVLLIVLSLVIPTRMGVTGIFWAAPVEKEHLA